MGLPVVGTKREIDGYVFEVLSRDSIRITKPNGKRFICDENAIIWFAENGTPISYELQCELEDRWNGFESFVAYQKAMGE